MTERARLVIEWQRRWSPAGRVNVSELCREFGISRNCGYKWIARFQAGGHVVAAVEERSRRPKTTPTAVDEQTQELVVAMRKRYPTWGPRKLRVLLADKYPGRELPSPSAIAMILKRRGLVRVPRMRRRARADRGVSPPFPECTRVNQVWCVDFKGWFRTLDGKKCHALTITDAYSRYVLRCEGVLDPDGPAVRKVFDSAFREFGIPDAIRSDNGPPFASTGAAGLSSLSVWWLNLGIRVQRIAPGKPQQNGRHERMHRTLKEDVPRRANLRRQQLAFDDWRRIFNDERPHEALSMRPPACIYRLSLKRYPRPHVQPEILNWPDVLVVDKNGSLLFQRRQLFISHALHSQRVVVERTSEVSWDVLWGSVLVGRIDVKKRVTRFVPVRRKRGQVQTLALVSDDE